PLWLEVEADGEILSPRRELVSAPYSLHDETGGSGDGHSLDADDGDPVDALYVDSEGKVGVGVTAPEAELHVRNVLQVGAGWTPGSMSVKSGYATSGAVRIEGEGAYGGTVYFDDGMGETYGFLGASASANGGGQLWLSRNSTGSTGFWLDANRQSSQNPRFEMLGADRGVIMDMDDSGNSSVILPGDAVSASEMLDEPGVASSVATLGPTITGSITSFDVRSLTAPADGYILAIGTAAVAVVHDGPSANTAIRLGLTDDYPSWTDDQTSYVMIPAGAADGQYIQIVTLHGVFSATGGQTKTIRMFGQRTQGTQNSYCNDVHMTLLFIPTARGTVELIDAP
ncbi:MAG: hypothetical protein JXB46_03730, partial [Candidatus Eisenbacteria bacterium]|nr:hypothetical protein [Candidatus Eisenbacteria bacterium]